MKNNVLDAIAEKRDEMSNGQSWATSRTYENTRRSLKKFMEYKKLDPKHFPFHIVTVRFLKDYEEWMMTIGARQRDKSYGPASLTTMSIYLRNLRTVCNRAVEDPDIKVFDYPFGRAKYRIPIPRGDRKPLHTDDVYKLLQYSSTDTNKQRSRDFWIMSYLCNGMNFTDVLHLRWRNLDFKTRTFTYSRSKTRMNCKVSPKPIHGYLHDETIAIIDRWANRSYNKTRQDSLVFPFLSDNTGVAKRYNYINSFICDTNFYMKEIAQELGIEGDVTTYIARHTFANVLHQNDAPLAFISASLGHTTLTTTQHYLSRFSDIRANDFLAKLIAEKPVDISKYPNIEFR